MRKPQTEFKTSVREREYARAHYRLNREKYREWGRRWLNENRERHRLMKQKNHLEEWGLTPEAYEDMVKAQGGCCAMCGRPPQRRRLAVDHDHQTGRIRGLLCVRCNVWLGGLERGKLEQAQAYLNGKIALKVA